MSYKSIEANMDDGVLVITLNDLATRNAWGAELAAEFNAEVDRFERDPEGRVLVITGTDPGFCSGANVRSGFDRLIREREAAESLPETLPWELMDHQYQVPPGTVGPDFPPRRLFRLQKPSVAAVNGTAFGLGNVLALSCDIRIASEKATFCESFIRVGLPAGDGSAWQLPKLIGLSNTFLLQYTGDAISAQEAKEMGLCSKVVPHEQLMPETMKLAKRIAQGPPLALSLSKYLIMHSFNLTLDQAVDMGRAAGLQCMKTEDHKEAVRAFMEKRPPKFKGR